MIPQESSSSRVFNYMKTKIRYCCALLILFIGYSGAAIFAEDQAQLSIPQGWKLQSWTADPKVLNAAPKRPAISFKNEKFFMSGGVNRMNGTYSARRNGRLILKRSGMTEMAGTPAAMKAEAIFTKLFKSVTHWRVQEKTLILSDGTSNLELRFHASAPAKAKPLTGTEWSLGGFEQAKSGQGESRSVEATSLVAGTTITLTIGADGRASGYAGVNRYFGKATPGEADQITFGPMASTRRGGPPEAMAQERAYLRQLGDVSRWLVNGNSLVLTGKDGSFTLRFDAK